MLSQLNTSQIVNIENIRFSAETAKQKRILWLINHTTLREFEIPMLVSMGYEIFTPKNIPDFALGWSGSNCYEYDSTLTIPEGDLIILNKHDFYDDPMNTEVASIINKHFASAFCVFYPPLLKQIIETFNGRILLRAFGLDKTASYSRIIEETYGRNFFSTIRRLGNRFWFSEAYDNLHKIENVLLKERRIYHPLGLPEHFYNHKDSWVGGEKKIIFFCPRIAASPSYYGVIYKEFKQNFGDFPHVVAGNQPVPVTNDPCVVGLQPRETINQWLKTHQVMFYHSDEPRHIHYHPLEALIFGMPVIFMRQGMMGHLGGPDQPGACETIEEAREKIRRILNDDKDFIAQVKKEQEKILTPFSLQYAKDLWNENFINRVFNEPLDQNVTSNTKKIAIFLPAAYKGGSLVAAKNIAKMMYIGSRANDCNIEIVFSCLANEYSMDLDFADLRALGITVSETTWVKVDQAQVKMMLDFQGEKANLTEQEYLVPTDNVANYSDCDLWLLISDRTTVPLAPLKPYGVVIYDYIQRYVPEIMAGGEKSFDNYIKTARAAKFVLCTTPQTIDDAIQYAGIKPEKVHLAPMDFEPFKDEPCQIVGQNDVPYFIWPTNTTCHKNHLKAIEALIIYYSELHGSLNVHMTGAETEQFLDPSIVSPYIEQVRKALNRLAEVRKSLHILGNLPRKDFINQLKRAKFIWHPTKIDNGTFVAIEGAYLGVPTLSNHYPQMKYLDERFALNIQFADANQPYKMALKLKEMEGSLEKLQLHLPRREFLDQFSYENLASEFWRKIWKLM